MVERTETTTVAAALDGTEIEQALALEIDDVVLDLEVAPISTPMPNLAFGTVCNTLINPYYA